MSAEKPAAERARQLAGTSHLSAQVYATLAIAESIRQAGSDIGAALVEAARIKAGQRR